MPISNERPFNLTICRTCSTFCKNGTDYCGKMCSSSAICPTCKTYLCLPRHNTCQYCCIKTSVYSKVRCLTCQRRCVAQDKYNTDYDDKHYCSKRCSDATICNGLTGPCGNKVWIDFGENCARLCLNCLWKLPIPIEPTDSILGRPPRISVIVKYGNEILVHKRGKDISYPGMISINSGTMEMSDESSYTCVARELFEEASLDIHSLGLLVRLSQTLFYVELSEEKFNELKGNMDQIHPTPEFEYEVDPWGYHFMHRQDMTFENSDVSIHLKRSLRVYDRYMSYITKSKTHFIRDDASRVSYANGYGNCSSRRSGYSRNTGGSSGYDVFGSSFMDVPNVINDSFWRGSKVGQYKRDADVNPVVTKSVNMKISEHDLVDFIGRLKRTIAGVCSALVKKDIDAILFEEFNKKCSPDSPRTSTSKRRHVAPLHPHHQGSC